MPEIAEVLSIAKFLNENIRGKYLQEILIYPNSKEYANFPNIDDLPWECVSVNYRSKRIVFFFRNKKGEEKFLFSFLGMTGKWLISEKKKEKNYLRYQLIFEDVILSYYDVRKFGALKLYSQEELNEYFKSVGPDWYNDKIKLSYFKEIAEKKPNKQVVEFLMDNKITTGIGNYLKSEIIYSASRELFQQGKNIILPDQKMSELNSDQISELYRACKRVIKNAIRENGYSLKDYVLPNGEKGTYSALVYSKKITPYNEKVNSSVFKDKRTTFWVSEFKN